MTTDQTSLTEIQTGIIGAAKAVYTDAGVAVENPSSFGGATAACFVYEDGHYALRTQLYHVRDIYPNGESGTVSNNVLELLAILDALMHLPFTWGGMVYTDSQTTLRRLTTVVDGVYPFIEEGYIKKTIPPLLYAKHRDLVDRSAIPLTNRMGLVKGHPSKRVIRQLEAGQVVCSPSNPDQPYSLYNCYADAAARDAIRSGFAVYRDKVGDYV